MRVYIFVAVFTFILKPVMFFCLEHQDANFYQIISLIFQIDLWLLTDFQSQSLCSHTILQHTKRLHFISYKTQYFIKLFIVSNLTVKCCIMFRPSQLFPVLCFLLSGKLIFTQFQSHQWVLFSTKTITHTHNLQQCPERLTEHKMLWLYVNNNLIFFL